MGYVNVARSNVSQIYELSIPSIIAGDVSSTILINGGLRLEDLHIIHTEWAETIHRYAILGARKLWPVAHNHYAHYDADADPPLDTIRAGEETDSITNACMEGMRRGSNECCISRFP
jgi:hypothetical protein